MEKQYGFFNIRDNVVIDGILYRVLDVVEDPANPGSGTVFCIELKNPRIKIQTYSIEEFNTLYQNGNLTVREKDEMPMPTEADEEDLELIERRKKALDEALALIYPNYDAFEHRKGKEVIESICKSLVVSDSSARALLNRYLKSGMNPYSLMDMRQGWNAQENAANASVNGRKKSDGTRSKVTLNDDTLNNFEMAFRYFKENAGSGVNLSDAYIYLIDMFYTDEDTLERLPEDECPSYRRFRSYVEKRLEGTTVRDFVKAERDKYKALPDSEKKNTIPQVLDENKDAKYVLDEYSDLLKKEDLEEDNAEVEAGTVIADHPPTAATTEAVETDQPTKSGLTFAEDEDEVPNPTVDESEKVSAFAPGTDFNDLLKKNEISEEEEIKPVSNENVESDPFAEEPESKEEPNPEEVPSVGSDMALETETEVRKEDTASEDQKPVSDGTGDYELTDHEDGHEEITKEAFEEIQDAGNELEVPLDDEIANSESVQKELSELKQEIEFDDFDTEIPEDNESSHSRKDRNRKKDKTDKKQTDSNDRDQEEKKPLNIKLIAIIGALAAVFVLLIVLLLGGRATTTNDITTIAEATTTKQVVSSEDMTAETTIAATTAVQTVPATKASETTIEVTTAEAKTETKTVIEAESTVEVTEVPETTASATTAQTTAQTTAPAVTVPETTAAVTVPETTAAQTNVPETSAAAAQYSTNKEKSKTVTSNITTDEQKAAAKSSRFLRLTGDNVNIRNYTTGQPIRSFPKGTILEQVAQSDDAAWLIVNMSGQKAKVSADYAASADGNSHKQYYRLTGDRVNVRSSENKDEIITQLPSGMIIEETGKYSDSRWIRFKYEGRSAIMFADYLEKVSESTEAANVSSTPASNETKQQPVATTETQKQTTVTEAPGQSAGTAATQQQASASGNSNVVPLEIPGYETEEEIAQAEAEADAKAEAEAAAIAKAEAEAEARADALAEAEAQRQAAAEAAAEAAADAAAGNSVSNVEIALSPNSRFFEINNGNVEAVDANYNEKVLWTFPAGTVFEMTGVQTPQWTPIRINGQDALIPTWVTVDVSGEYLGNVYRVKVNNMPIYGPDKATIIAYLPSGIIISENSSDDKWIGFNWNGSQAYIVKDAVTCIRY